MRAANDPIGDCGSVLSVTNFINRFYLDWLFQIRAERRTIFTRCFQQRPRFGWLGAPVESGDRA